MTYDVEEVLEACDVLERHNRTGTTVMKFTVGKWTEQKAIRVVITAIRELISEREKDRELIDKLSMTVDRIQEHLDDIVLMKGTRNRVVE